MPIRHITRGIVDGSLASLGIALGAAISGEPKVIIAAGLGGGIASAIAAGFSAMTAERAEVMKTLAKYERAMVGSEVRLKNTKIYDKERKRIFRSGIYDGGATLLGSLVPIIPFALLGINNAIIAAVIVTVVLLFGVGAYLGKISKENLFIAGSKLALIGAVTAVITGSLELLFK